MNIGFISTRLAGNDGVSLETAKLATVLSRRGHALSYLAGELDSQLPGMEVPELHFEDPVARSLGERAFGIDPYSQLLSDIASRAEELKRPIRNFLDRYEINFVIIQNAFAIPMQLPLAQALAEVIAQRHLPGLAHNHDFYWERERFRSHHLGQFLDRYFPPALDGLQQATINSLAQAALRERRGLESIVVPNVMDFANPPPDADAYALRFRQDIGLSADDRLILQPTRVIPRKGIELAIEAVARLEDPRAKLVITHRSGDEGEAYLDYLIELARQKRVDLRYVAGIVDDKRGRTDDGRPVYALWDTYAVANFVMYPSLIEGFGNALLETIYFRLPALVNRYDVYVADIAPKGLRFVEIEGEITDEAVQAVANYLHRPELAAEAAGHNYALARQHYSYETLEDLVSGLGL